MNPEDVPEIIRQLKPYVAEACEVSLADWQDNPNSGAWVKLRLPDETHLEVYRGRPRAGRTQKFGQRYHMILIEIGDDEMPQPNPEPPSQERRPYKLSQIAGSICHDPKFREWAEAEYGEPVPDEAAAAQLIRDVCGVESRAHLDANPDAAKLFRELLADFDRSKNGASEQA